MIKTNDTIAKNKSKQILYSSRELAKSFLCSNLHPDSKYINKHCVDDSYGKAVDTNLLEAYWDNQERDTHKVSHVLYEGHEVAARTLSLSFFVDTGSPVKVARVWLALVKPRLDRVDGIVVKNWLEIVLVLISLRRLVLVSQSTLVTCNRSIHVVILVLVVIRVSIRMEPLTINVIHLLF